jgi:hypothetical protein
MRVPRRARAGELDADERSATHSSFVTSRFVRYQSWVSSHSEGRLKAERRPRPAPTSLNRSSGASRSARPGLRQGDLLSLPFSAFRRELGPVLDDVGQEAAEDNAARRIASGTPTLAIRGRGGIRTRVTRFAGEPLNHSGTRPC